MWSFDASLIDWAFVCRSARVDERGGVDALGIFDKFPFSEASGLTLVYCLTVPRIDVSGGQHTYSFLKDYRLTINLQTPSEKKVQLYTTETFVHEQTFIYPLGQHLAQPGAYTLEIQADGLTQYMVDFQIM